MGAREPTIPESTNATPAGQEVERVARIAAASDALLSKPYLSDNDRDRVRAITAAALASPSVATPVDDAGMRDGWNPIATVDRANGKRLILAWDDCATLPYHWEVGRWSRNLGWVNTYGHPFSGEPTHWMEPSSPSAASPKTPSVAIGAERANDAPSSSIHYCNDMSGIGGKHDSVGPDADRKTRLGTRDDPAQLLEADRHPHARRAVSAHPSQGPLRAAIDALAARPSPVGDAS